MSNELTSIIKKLWVRGYFKQAVERRISNAKGVERAAALLLKQIAEGGK